ncbi:hypothetical protein GGI21_000224 [Coemansia aciculifera]|nr:hypothetical protein GGI21_000224 [Coemansia aciculifera]
MSESSMARVDSRHHHHHHHLSHGSSHGMHAHHLYQNYQHPAPPPPPPPPPPALSQSSSSWQLGPHPPPGYYVGRHYAGPPAPAPPPPAVAISSSPSQSHSPTVTSQHGSMSPLVRVVAAASGGSGCGSGRRKRSKTGEEAAVEEGHSGTTGSDAARILEDRRRRNASASARFRRRRNERERELVGRCMFLEQRLAEALGPRAFEEVMKKAPVSVAALEGGRRPVSMASDDDDEWHGVAAAAAHSPLPTSVCALTAPRSIDDVWAAYLSLSQQVADSSQRITMLENKK